MDNEHNPVEELISKTGQYANTSFELGKLKLIESAGNTASSLTATIVAAIIFLLALLIASIGLSIYIGKVLGEIYDGFFVVAGGYVLTGIFFYFFLHAQVKKSVNASLNKKLFN
jgi:hypothetical protein